MICDYSGSDGIVCKLCKENEYEGINGSGYCG
jgi:hypothetical protein